jgi:hypothetical protein
MKYILILFVAIFSVSCFDKSDDAGNSSVISDSIDVNHTEEEVFSENNSNNEASKSIPELSDYPRECPVAWGVVKGTTQAKVENFIQNYFHVPENPTPMYSEINHYAQDDGSTLLKAGTYKMQDNIFDQEMLAIFVSGKMTQCGVRLRCASNPNKWVESCD